MAIDELADVLGRASIEAVLQLSAQGVAGKKQRGRAKESIRWHGRQAGSVRLSDRKLRVRKPRLRKKGPGKGQEVEIPAYEAINANGKIGSRVLEILMSNVSIRQYERVIPQMADTVGVSKSSVSREFVEQSGKELKRLSERRFEDREFLVIYLDGDYILDAENYKRYYGFVIELFNDPTVASGCSVSLSNSRFTRFPNIFSMISASVLFTRFFGSRRFLLLLEF